jgi:ABC-2 type transport system permease protein
VASIALGYVSAIVSQENAAIAVQSDLPPPMLIERSWFNENMLSRWYILSALGGVISMVVVTILTSLSVAREREFGTFDQLLVAPFRPSEILIGKAMPGLVFGLMDSTLLSLAAIYWFGVPMRGSVLALMVALGIFVLAVVGMGLFISSISMTMQQALLGSFIFIMPSVILGGFTTPIQNMPQWLQYATYLNPLRYVVTALRQVFLQGAQMSDIWPQLWPMAIIAMVTLPVAGWMFRHRTG